MKRIALIALVLAVASCSGDSNKNWSFAEKALIVDPDPVMRVLTIEHRKDSLILRTPSAELPAELVQKTPTDGLSGVSDEEKLGLRYQDIHNYIRLGTCGDPETDRKIAGKEAANMHKRRMPLILNPFEAGDGNA